MLAGRLWRHLAVRFSRLAGRGLGNRPDRRGNPVWPGSPGKVCSALARSRNNISRLEVELGVEGWARPVKNMLATPGESDLELVGLTVLTEFLKLGNRNLKFSLIICRIFLVKRSFSKIH